MIIIVHSHENSAPSSKELLSAETLYSDYYSPCFSAGNTAIKVNVYIYHQKGHCSTSKGEVGAISAP